MKNAAKLSGARRSMAGSVICVIVLTALFGFIMTACGDGAGGGSDGGLDQYTSSIDIEMVWISAGHFLMGSPTSEPGRITTPGNEDQHSVTLTNGFYMGKYEVTQAQYQAVIGKNPSYFKTPVSPETSTVNRPVDSVSWYDALVFCNKLSMTKGLSPAYRISGSTDPAVWGSVPTTGNATWNAATIVVGSTGYRLPTEAQWEYACRAGTTTAFNWGSSYINTSKANYYASDVDACNTYGGIDLLRTTGVGSYPPNAWGLYDMHGNVSEWCWDWGGNYSSGPQVDPMGPDSGSTRPFRGGDWNHYGRQLRSASRNFYYPNYHFSSYGFRVIRP